jgi:hypothetical protein
VIVAQPYCCPASGASCVAADGAYRCRSTSSSSSAASELRNVSPWYALLSLIIPIACIGTCCYMCLKKPSEQPARGATYSYAAFPQYPGQQPIAHDARGQPMFAAAPPRSNRGYGMRRVLSHTGLSRPPIAPRFRFPIASAAFQLQLTRL